MATHSSVLAWRIPGMGSLVGCCLWGRTKSDTTEAAQQQFETVALFSLSFMWGHRYHLSKFHLCAFIYCIGVSLFDFFHSMLLLLSLFSHVQLCATP